jgi:hypothetical protein
MRIGNRFEAEAQSTSRSGRGSREYPDWMSRSQLLRTIRVLDGLTTSLARHAETCGDWIMAIALGETDFEELELVEVWGLPVLAWEEVGAGRVKLLCQRESRLVPPHETVEDLIEAWECRLQPPPA